MFPVYHCVPGPELDAGGAPCRSCGLCKGYTATKGQQLPLPKTGHI